VLRPRGPRPAGLPIAVGASGPKLMRLAARFADEWKGLTFSTPTLDHFAPVLRSVDAACREVGRDLATLRRSIGIIVAEVHVYLWPQSTAAVEAMAPALKAPDAAWRASLAPGATDDLEARLRSS
jgi:alkanesulfonate monooxygenase SsuD/methylene tetrahydromethanopterin reductase-like flavin-dependent oxidoreductase (luciferase family)